MRVAELGDRNSKDFGRRRSTVLGNHYALFAQGALFVCRVRVWQSRAPSLPLFLVRVLSGSASAVVGVMGAHLLPLFVSSSWKKINIISMSFRL